MDSKEEVLLILNGIMFHDPRISKLVQKYGMEGYGTYMYLIEFMLDDENLRLKYDFTIINCIRENRNITLKLNLNEFIGDCEKLKLFQYQEYPEKNESYLLSNDLIEIINKDPNLNKEKMKTKNYIKIVKDIQNHWIWRPNNEPFSIAQAWIDLLLTADVNQGTNFVYPPQNIHLETGQLIITQKHLEDRWLWSKQRVSKFLKLLIDEDMIIKKPFNHWYTIIEIVNYKKYQS